MKNKHNSPMEYRVKYRINGSKEKSVQYYNVFHSSEALDFLAHTFRRDHIEGKKLTIISVEEYNRFGNTWNDRLEKAVEFSNSPEIITIDNIVYLTKE